MNEQRKDILDMLAEGKITTEEAERLIAALERDQPPAPSSPDARPKGKAKYLRVVVDTLEDGERGRVRGEPEPSWTGHGWVRTRPGMQSHWVLDAVEGQP